jgi:hypothetical protein
MAHVAWLMPEIRAKDWMEPHDNAELFIRYTNQCYSCVNYYRIHALVGFRGYLFLRGYDPEPDEWVEEMGYGSEEKEEEEEEEFDAVARALAIAKSNPRVLSAYIGQMAEKVATRETGLKELMQFYDENEFADDGGTERKPESNPKLNSTLDVLRRFYRCVQGNRTILADKFPGFHDRTHPFPCNVDDGTLARNLYARHETDATGISIGGGGGGTENHRSEDCENDSMTSVATTTIRSEQDSSPTSTLISHVFVGEVHVWDNQSPWTRSAWERVETVFAHKNVMLFELFLKPVDSNEI